MAKIIELTSKDPILDTLKFKPHKSMVERHFERFLPGSGEPNRMEVPTPWGESLIAKAGDYLLSEMDDPGDSWPVDAKVFEKSYEILRPGVCVKTALTDLVPLIDVTDGDADQEVTVRWKVLKRFAQEISISREDRTVKFGLIRRRRSQI